MFGLLDRISQRSFRTFHKFEDREPSGRDPGYRLEANLNPYATLIHDRQPEIVPYLTSNDLPTFLQQIQDFNRHRSVPSPTASSTNSTSRPIRTPSRKGANTGTSQAEIHRASDAEDAPWSPMTVLSLPKHFESDVRAVYSHLVVMQQFLVTAATSSKGPHGRIFLECTVMIWRIGTEHTSP